VVDRFVTAPKVSSDFIGETKIIKEVDALKRIAFLIIGTLLVLGLILPGCTEDTNGVTLTPTTITFDKQAGKIVVGIPGEYTHATGGMAYLGAVIAEGAINGPGGIVIDDDVGGGTHSYNYSIVFVETGEATVDPTGAAGVTAMNDKKDEVDFFAGGFRTEALDVYRDVVMKNDGTGMIFINCGAATEALCHSCVSNYANYRFFFKGTPYNEYFLAQSVVRVVDSVAKQIRSDAALPDDCVLNATIVADNLEWAFDQVEEIDALLADINVERVGGPFWVDATAADGGTEMSSLMQNQIAALDPVLLIPVLSSNAGIYYDAYRNAFVGTAMSAGINVLAQLKTPWAGGAELTNPPGLTQPYCANEIILDTWAQGVNMTGSTYGFLTTFMGYMYATKGLAEYPLYTAATYDVLWTMKAAIEANAVYNTGTGKATADADAIIQWLENPANAQTSTTGQSMYYPKWNGSTYCGSDPALTSTQVAGLYPSATYAACDWAMPGHTTHDLVYGPGYLTGIGAQWQWDGVGGAWHKVGIWPIDYGSSEDAALTDQYGCWNMDYPGIVPMVIPSAVVSHAACMP
jgi:hypothetical protein